MKNILLILFLSTLSSTALTVTSNDITIDRTNGYTVYKKGTNKLLTATLNYYHDDNKTLKETLPLKNGQINGLFKSFYPSGKLKSKIDYRESKREGSHKVYYENGKINYEANMQNEKKNGHAKEWYKNGQLRFDILFENNKANGMVKIYKEDGTIESISEYAQGKEIKQIQPKEPNNRMLQTRAFATYGSGEEIYYLFISPICPACKSFLNEIEKYKKEVTFYVYLVPLKGGDVKERDILNIIYTKKFSNERMKAIFDFKNNKLDLKQKIEDKDTYVNNAEIPKAQQMQIATGVRSVPTLVDTKGFRYSIDEFKSKFKK
ncbi:MAG TPA: hypothetical protein EYG85_11960 [Crocinitomix sp.]|nr:hypothetical protein [Crocinitomix sp.]